ncbi:MAG: hypothetical protein AB7U75_02045 [Hyphomicrobiaceae bacterium]
MHYEGELKKMRLHEFLSRVAYEFRRAQIAEHTYSDFLHMPDESLLRLRRRREDIGWRVAGALYMEKEATSHNAQYHS